MEAMSQTELATLLGMTRSHLRDLETKGVIERVKGKYPPKCVAAYVKHLLERLEADEGESYSELLEREKYRKEKRQNDEAESLLAPIELLGEALASLIAQMVPVLEGLPLMIKRNFPEVTGDQMQLVKKAVAECRNIMADCEVKLDDSGDQ